jgi:hypothetical protein
VGTLIRRLKGALLLDVETFEEVEHDPSAMGQAVLVVLLAALAEAVGGNPTMEGYGFTSVFALGLVRWALWSAITWFIGTRVFGGTADWGELLRTIAFAQAPALFMVLGGIPWIGSQEVAASILGAVVYAWLLVAVIVAIRQALDVSTIRALLTALLGLAPHGFFMALFL